ncbi:EF-hand domain-containing protein [Lacinutrix chionoecetis]
MKSNSITNTVFILGFTLLISNNSFGQSQDRQGKKPPTFKELLKEMDKDKDGKLSKAEIKGPLSEHFDKVDLDEDGFITEKEFKKAPKPKQGQRK